ncbi:hypothetical protein GCM10027456_63700 [Kineosporia babensis]
MPKPFLEEFRRDVIALARPGDATIEQVVGYSIDSRMKASLAVRALKIAVALRNPRGTIVHLDRGSQFRSKSSSAP